MNTTRLDNTLRKTGRMVMLIEATRAALVVVAVLIVAALLAIAVDAIVGLRPVGLVVVDAMLLILAVVAIGYIILHVLRHTFDRRRIARLIEERLQLHQSELINAVELAESSRDGTSAELREATVACGVQLAATLAPSRLIDKRPAKRACGLALAALALTALLYLLLPTVFQSVIPRLLDPYGDLPPFTLVNFTFDHPSEVYEGKPATIRVTLTGHNLPDQANIVFVDAVAGSEQTISSLPMLRVEGAKETGDRGQETGDGPPNPGLRFALPIDKADRTRVFYVNTAAGRSERRTLAVLPVPRFEQVTVTYDPPAYTGWKRTVEHLNARGIRAFEGTNLTVTVNSNLPLERGEIDWQWDVPGLVRGKNGTFYDQSTGSYGMLGIWWPHLLKPNQRDPRIAAVTIRDVIQSGRFSITLTAANATRTQSLEPLTGKITVAPDGPPKVRITEPGDRQIIAPEGWKVPVHIEAEDDVRIERLILFRGVNGFSPTAVQLPLTDKGPGLASSRYEFDLGALGARAGDAITFFATAHDNYPGVPGGHSADTDTYTIHVISMEDYLTQARSDYRMDDVLEEIERFDRLLNELDAKREALLKQVEALNKKIEEQGGVPTAEDLKKLDELNAKLAEYAEQQWKLAKEMRERSEQPNLYDFERAYAQMLAEQADQLDRGAEDATKLKRENEFNRKENPNDKAEAQRQLKEMAKQLKKDEQRLDDAQQQAKAAEGDMKTIEQADHIMAQAERMTAIIQEQRDLADRMAQFKSKEKLTPAEQLRAHRMAQEQQALKDELDDTIKQLDEAAKNAEKDLPNMAESAREISEAVKALGVGKDQSEAERLAMAGKGQGAHKSAESAASKLESLLGQCEGMQGEGQKDMADAKFKLQNQSAGQSLQQLSQGRGLPQMGSKPGQQAGKQGSSGTRGSRGKFSVYGPHKSGKEGSERRGGKDGTGQGTGANSDSAVSAGAESLSPDTAASRGQGATAIPGVPTRYRDLADQYFRRLAEEAK